MNKPSLPFFCHACAASSLAKARPNRYSEKKPSTMLSCIGDFRDDGVEFMPIPASGDIDKELGIELNADRESLDSDDRFKDLRMDKKNKPTEPLTKGEWK